MYIIDFDDTLFDTQGYHAARFQAIEKLGVPKDLYWQAYYNSRLDEQGNFIYNDTRHAIELEKSGFSREDVLDSFNSVSIRAKDFLFSDACDFLQEIKNTGKPMFLLTWGEPEFQRLSKVGPSEISHYFDEVLYTHEPKDKYLCDFFKKNTADEVWFVNDKPAETIRLAGLFPQLKPVLKFSRFFTEADYQNLGIPYFLTLTEIKDYVLK